MNWILCFLWHYEHFKSRVFALGKPTKHIQKGLHIQKPRDIYIYMHDAKPQLLAPAAQLQCTDVWDTAMLKGG